MIISKYKEGELVWKRKFSNPDPQKVFNRIVDRLNRLGYFVENGYDSVRDCLWLIVGSGDNCLRFEKENEIPDCPVCGADRELAGIPGRYNCYFCGLKGSI